MKRPAPYQLQSPTGRTVSVLRPAGYPDTTAGGISGQFDSLMADGHPTGPADPRNVRGVKIIAHAGYYIAFPVVMDRPGAFGGNYLHCSDGLWTRQYPHPVPVYDRYGG